MYALSISTIAVAVVLCLGIHIIPGLAETNTHCGGVLKVGLDSPATINYKLNEEYDNKEQCVWTIRVDGLGADRLRFVKKESNFELRYDFLQLSAFRSSNLLLPSETRTLGNVHEQEEVTITAPFVFVTFSTDDSNTGSGFSLEIEAVAGSNNYNYVHDDFFSDAPVGNTSSLKPYLDNTFTTYVITANNVDSLELGVEFDLETGADFVSVFHLERNGGRILFFPYGLLTGTSNWYYTVRSYTTFVLIFKTDGSIVRDGIDLDWKQGKDTGTEKPPMDW